MPSTNSFDFHPKTNKGSFDLIHFITPSTALNHETAELPGHRTLCPNSGRKDRKFRKLLNSGQGTGKWRRDLRQRA